MNRRIKQFYKHWIPANNSRIESEDETFSFLRCGPYNIRTRANDEFYYSFDSKTQTPADFSYRYSSQRYCEDE